MSLIYSIVDLDGADFDAAGDAASEIAQKIVVCSPPRTGSYLLCEAMRRIGLGIPHEYFNPPTVEALSARWELEPPRAGVRWSPLSRQRADRTLSGYLETLERRRSHGGIFAMKIQFWQFRKYLDNARGDAFLDGAHFVYLHRRALLDQAISLRFAKVTGQWGVDGRVTTRTQPKADFFRLGEIDRAIRDIVAEERGWRGFFARRSIVPAVLSYESLRDDPLGAARGLAQTLGLQPAPQQTPTDTPAARGETDDTLRRLRIAVRDLYLARRARLPPEMRWPDAAEGSQQPVP